MTASGSSRVECTPLKVLITNYRTSNVTRTEDQVVLGVSGDAKVIPGFLFFFGLLILIVPVASILNSGLDRLGEILGILGGAAIGGGVIGLGVLHWRSVPRILFDRTSGRMIHRAMIRRTVKRLGESRRFSFFPQENTTRRWRSIS